MLKTYKGSCHCGDVRYEADVDLASGTGRCNCSICAKSRFWGILVKPVAFRMLSSEDALSDYQFASKQGHHLFCKRCGLTPFTRGDVPEIGGAFVSINIACLDGVSDDELASLPITYANGRDNDWMHAPAVTRHL